MGGDIEPMESDLGSGNDSPGDIPGWRPIFRDGEETSVRDWVRPAIFGNGAETSFSAHGDIDRRRHYFVAAGDKEYRQTISTMVLPLRG